MIPSTSSFLSTNFTVTVQPTKTYKMNREKLRIRGYTDELDAMEQAVYKILLTERYDYEIYSSNYGIELKELFGEPISYVIPELERRITEALTWDDRIDSVDNYEFEVSKRTVHAFFTVHTTFGDLDAETEVNI